MRDVWMRQDVQLQANSSATASNSAGWRGNGLVSFSWRIKAARLSADASEQQPNKTGKIRPIIFGWTQHEQQRVSYQIYLKVWLWTTIWCSICYTIPLMDLNRVLHQATSPLTLKRIQECTRLPIKTTLIQFSCFMLHHQYFVIFSQSFSLHQNELHGTTKVFRSQLFSQLTGSHFSLAFIFDPFGHKHPGGI